MKVSEKLNLFLFLLIGLLIGVFQTATSLGQVDIIALRGATVIDALGNPPLPNAVVVIEGDKITSVSQSSSDIPLGATVLDLTGRFLIPGLIDSHVHWDKWMGEIYINHGVTSLLAQGDISREERDDSWTSLSTPRVFHTGGRPRLSPSMSRQEVREAIEAYLKREPDVAWFLQLRENNKEVFRWGAEEAHRAGLAVFSHTQDAAEAIDAGMDVAEHVWGFAFPLMTAQELDDFKKGRFLHWASYLTPGRRLDDMIRAAVAKGVYLNPTLVYEWGSLSPKALEREQEGYLLLSNPDLSYFPRNLAGVLLLRHRQIKGYSSRHEHLPLVAKLSEGDLETFQGAKRNVQRFVHRYVELGGKIIAGTDAASVAIPGLAMHHEMELLVEAGLTPMQALQAGTSWAADMFSGFEGARGNQRVGSIQEGNYADLLVLEADPLQDIANTKKIERVMKGGRFIEFGYHPEFFTFDHPPFVSMAVPEPEISSIFPHKVVEGTSGFEIVIEGAGFVGNSVVRAAGVSLETTFESPRELRATVPAEVVEKAVPDRFRSPGPDQYVGIFGDRTVAVTVFNPPPTGGTSNSVSLIIQAKWHEGE